MFQLKIKFLKSSIVEIYRREKKIKILCSIKNNLNVTGLTSFLCTSRRYCSHLIQDPPKNSCRLSLYLLAILVITRGHTSKIGVGCVIDILYTTTLCPSSVKNASWRSLNLTQTNWYEGHKDTCDINHTGSSGAMEVVYQRKRRKIMLNVQVQKKIKLARKRRELSIRKKRRTNLYLLRQE